MGFTDRVKQIPSGLKMPELVIKPEIRTDISRLTSRIACHASLTLCSTLWLNEQSPSEQITWAVARRKASYTPMATRLGQATIGHEPHLYGRLGVVRSCVTHWATRG